MSYLTYDEFTELIPTDIEETVFNLLLPKASDVLEDVTHQYYQKHSFEEDNPWRVRQFKKALCAQIAYFDEVGSTTSEGIDKERIQSFSVGRTKVSYSSQYSRGEYKSRSLVAKDVFIYLRGTGLLYAGVGAL